MKIDAICVDRNDVKAEVTVDLDYVSSVDQIKTWLENELYVWALKNKTDFDTMDFVVTNWDEVAKAVEEGGLT